MSRAIQPGTPAVVLLSGGLDSTVTLAAARAEGYRCHALSFDYGQRHRHELDAAARVARHLGAVDHRTIAVDLRAIGGSALTADIPVPKRGMPRVTVVRREEDSGAGSSALPISKIPVTYVPGRNLIFLSLAVGYAETIGAWDLFLGINSVDYSGYPDCRWPFITAFIETANLATKAWDDRQKGPAGRRAGFVVHAPLIDQSKEQIVRWGKRLGVDFSLTHSCYDPDPDGLACGRCDSCVLRARGFEAAGVADPTRYAADAAPKKGKPKGAVGGVKPARRSGGAVRS